MPGQTPHTLPYRRARFATALSEDRLYCAGHAWLARIEAGVWRVGLTQFATRQLGEMVDHGFHANPGDAVVLGQVIGWIEGFKAVSDLLCVVAGEFLRSNAELKDQLTLLTRDPYEAGWLYEVKGSPDVHCFDVQAYTALLDRIIDRLNDNRGPASGD